jgi:RIO kinase 1
MAINKRQQKERPKTYKGVFDKHTERALFKLASEGHFDHLAEPLCIGKESNVFTAIKKTRDTEKKFVVKIYRVENCDFSKMYSYIRTDPRFLDLKKKKRLIIFAWARREFRNLLKAREAGCTVPTPRAIKDHIIVMEHIGDEKAAPMLKDQHPKDPEAFADAILKNMAKLHKADMVHGDLSSFNILNYNEKPVFIDFSQSTLTTNINAEELFERDTRNIQQYLNKLGIVVEIKKIKRKIKGK